MSKSKAHPPPPRPELELDYYIVTVYYRVRYGLVYEHTMDASAMYMVSVPTDTPVNLREISDTYLHKCMAGVPEADRDPGHTPTVTVVPYTMGDMIRRDRSAQWVEAC